MNKEYQELFKSLMFLKKYCEEHDCDSKCEFFLTGGGCSLRSGKSPNFWHIPNTILTGMECEELIPVEIGEKENDNTMVKEGD